MTTNVLEKKLDIIADYKKEDTKIDSDCVLVLEEKTGNKYFLKEMNKNSEKDTVKCATKLQEYSELCKKYDFLHRLVDWSVEKYSNWCSTSWKILAFYEPMETDLKKEVEDAHKKGRVMNSQILIPIAYGVLNTIDVLSKSEKNYNDIRPENIGLRADRSAFLRKDVTVPGKRADKVLANNLSMDKKVYASPDLWNNFVASKKMEDQKFDDRNDVFSLGMNLLQGGIMSDVQECYVEKEEFNYEKLNNFKEEFYANNHGQRTLISHIIDMCLRLPAHHRLNAGEILNTMPKFEQISSYYLDSRIELVNTHETDNLQLNTEENEVKSARKASSEDGEEVTIRRVYSTKYEDFAKYLTADYTKITVDEGHRQDLISAGAQANIEAALNKKFSKFELVHTADQIPVKEGHYRRSINAVDCGEGLLVFHLDLESDHKFRDETIYQDGRKVIRERIAPMWNTYDAKIDA